MGSCVILAVCEPENPIICSRIAAGARLAVPCCDVTRYLAWYCHGANRRWSACHRAMVSGFSLVRVGGGNRPRRGLVWSGNERGPGSGALAVPSVSSW